MDISGKRVLIVGTGKSGIGAANLLLRVNAVPILFDENEQVDVSKVKSLMDREVEVIIGVVSEEVIQSIDLLVLSPGVPTDTEFVKQFHDRKIPVWGEIELGYQFAKGKLLAITGTNGKTTTTALLGQIVKEFNKSTFVVGNIGNPYTLEALNTVEDSVTVAEVSSFQLETALDFKPDVSAILNISPDHLNRHHTMENYVSAKESITKNQDKSNVCVLNYEDEYTRAFGERCPANVFYFSSARRLEKGIYLENENIYLSDDYHSNFVMNIHDMKLLGIHNVENVMAAIAMAISCGIPMVNVVKTIKSFQAVEHRIEFVSTKNGVDYYNDSKGTNPDAAIKGIKAMTRKTVLIGGGYDKGSEFDEWLEAFDGKVKWLILLGQTKEKIAECAIKHGFGNIVYAQSLEEAVKMSEEKAESGDAVLLSPACASWGMFPNYEVRGNRFKELVQRIKE